MTSNSNGYHDGGEPPEHRDFATAFGGPFYNSYPLQMFDRKLRPLSDVYVGLVCTRRRLTGENTARYRQQLKANARSNAERDAIDAAVYFYTFHYACFSSNQAFGHENENFNVRRDGYQRNPSLSEPATKRSRKHYEDALPGEEYDPYRGISDREWHGMIGAWRVGKVLDIAAAKKDQYNGGPVDTAERITVNVDIEFKDWRQLRRDFGFGTVGMDVPGAGEWGLVELDGAGAPVLDANGVNIPLNPADLVTGGQFPQDEGFVLQWPTVYEKPGKRRRDDRTWGFNLNDHLIINPMNVPLDPTTIDEAIRGYNIGTPRRDAADILKGAGTFSRHGMGRDATSTRPSIVADLHGRGQPTPLADDYTPGEGHEYSLLRAPADQLAAYQDSLIPEKNDGAGGTEDGTYVATAAPNPTVTVPDPENFGLDHRGGDESGPFADNVRAPAPGAGTVADVVMAPPSAAPKSKGKAVVGSSAAGKKKAAPPKPKPAAASAAPVPQSVAATVVTPAAVPTLSATTGAAATVAAARSGKSQALSPVASPSVANTGAATDASVAVPPAARQGPRRGRAGEQATADVFASIFGGDAAAPTSSSSAAAVAEPSAQPSPSEGSEGGSSGRGRVRRARDGR